MISADVKYVLAATFRAKQSARCTIDDEHRIKRDDLVGKLQRADNPFITVPGLACKNCIKGMARA